MVISNGRPVAAQDDFPGTITFTADNAAQIFLNGEPLKDAGGLSYTNDWKSPFVFKLGSELSQGENVIGVAAWDHESIAAMSGMFNMADGTKFGTSSEGWLVFDAGVNVNTCKDKQNCTDFPRSLGNAYQKYVNGDISTLVRIPDEWNEVGFVPSDFKEGKWTTPGTRSGNPWEKDKEGKTTGDPTWIWWGKDTADGGFYGVNFALFRFKFQCLEEYCAPEAEWERRYVINVDSRSWDQIILSSEKVQDNAEANTYPIFAGGILSFKDSGNLDNYSQNFYLTNSDSFLWNKDENSENTIDLFGNQIVFTGVLSGPGGMAYRSSGRGDGVAELADINTYTGETIVRSGTLRVTGKLSDSTIVNVNAKGNYRVSSDDTIFGLKGNGSVLLDDGKTLTVSPDLNHYLYFRGEISGLGDFEKAGAGTQFLTGKSSYQGETLIKSGVLQVSGAGDLPDTTPVTVSNSGIYKVDSTDTIGSLAGNGIVVSTLR